MTDEQLDVARQQTGAFEKTLGWKPNLSFLKGYIEFLEEAGVKPNSVDVVISNCVINLSPRKELVLKSVYKVLREGGEFYFSDVYADRRLPDEIRTHNVLLGECLGGALYVGDFKHLCKKAGFLDPRAVQITPLTVEDEELSQLVGNTKFYSITYRLFKLANLEDACEDYGQIAIYKGTIPGHPHNYVLDSDHIFSSNKPMLVCGNTASMVGESWLKEHFIISGDRSTHYGLFDCGSKNTIMSAAVPAEKGEPACSTGSCC
ncbi:S-adenosyl-L-methionine-dependent methyltransferase [Paraphysoderma sedebokerense]|nr:S-adenosyl-L-methionine-dependent methyltransferase [Paraphysoderma sedebokerense]